MADTNNFVQLQSLYLAGSGAGLADTSIILTKMKLPDGTTNVAMTDFGTTGYATLEPGSSREENILFTGITQNASGTATLTGVTRGLNFVAPYTAVAANRFSHAGGTTLVISDSSAFFNELSGKDNDETITGIWTFTNTAMPRLDSYLAPTLDAEFAAKKYADDLAIAGSPDMTTTVKGIAEEATLAEVDAGTAAGGTGARLAVNPSTLATSIYATRLPTADEKAALAGTGTPNVTNKYVTNDDVTEAKTASKIPRRDANSDILVATTPTAGDAATSKTYVDNSRHGSGSDGALDTSSGTVNINLGTATYVEKNYTSITVTGNNLTFSNPATTGTIIALLSQGNVVVSATIDAKGMGAAGGAAASNGTTSHSILDDSAHLGATGDAAGGTPANGGVIYTNKALYSNSQPKVIREGIFIAPGSGGGGGSNDNTSFAACGGGGAGAFGGAGGTGNQGSGGAAAGGASAGGGGAGGSSTSTGTGAAGGRGGGAVYIECGGDLNFTGTLDVSGVVGTLSASATGGAGGGGAGGMGVILYDTLTSSAGTINSAGGAGGANTADSYSGGAGGATNGGFVGQLFKLA